MFIILGLQSGKEDIDLPSFDFPAISIATGHFSQANMIGVGGFGTVYKVNGLWSCKLIAQDKLMKLKEKCRAFSQRAKK